MKIRLLLLTIVSVGFAHAETQSVKVPGAAMKRDITATVTVPDGYQNTDKPRPGDYWKAALPRQMAILHRHFQVSRPAAAGLQPVAP